MPTRTATVTPTLHDAWATWITHGKPWQLFLTMTTESRSHPEAVLKRFRYCTHLANDAVYGRRWERRDQGCQWVAGIERHKSWNPHLHAVLTFPDFDMAGEMGRTFFPVRPWQERFTETGGICRLDLVRSTEDVASYVSKYVVKDGELHWSRHVSFAQAPGSPGELDLEAASTRQAQGGRRGGGQQQQ